MATQKSPISDQPGAKPCNHHAGSDCPCLQGGCVLGQVLPSQEPHRPLPTACPSPTTHEQIAQSESQRTQTSDPGGWTASTHSTLASFMGFTNPGLLQTALLGLGHHWPPTADQVGLIAPHSIHQSTGHVQDRAVPQAARLQGIKSAVIPPNVVGLALGQKRQAPLEGVGR